MKNWLKVYSIVCLVLAAVYTAVGFILPSNVGEFYRYRPILIISIFLVDLMFAAHLGVTIYSVLTAKPKRKDDMFIPKLFFKNALFLIVLLIVSVIIAVFTVIPAWVNPIVCAVIVLVNLIVIFRSSGVLETFIKSICKLFSKKSIRFIFIPSTAILVASTVLLFSYIIPNTRYEKAIKFLNDGNLDAACSMFFRISNFKDSSEKIKEIVAKDQAYSIYTAQIGDSIKFGKYEQDAVKENGAEPLEWWVIDKKDNKVFLICKNCIEALPYNDKVKDITWKDSTLRAWLNNDFYNLSFSEYEKQKIDSTRLINHDNPNFIAPKGGKNTVDKIFVLSLNEGEFYLRNNEKLQATATQHVINQAANVNSETKYGIWWLRTPGATNTTAVMSHTQLGFSSVGQQVSHTAFCARPALWIEL